ncbi:MAG TPA: amino acid permease [Thermoanaerobaculia bacterium]|nr:amino acid permease [Thermoanaerobaculia bacterium]HQR66116.1 amino acid permease [Thermoanaerobaculia bacterium]
MPDTRRIRQALLGRPRDVKDPGVFHHISLVAFLAWVGLGADGLSSSAYGPDEAFRALGSHHALAIVLVGMTAVTITVISIAYSDVIQHFPGGGGGYLVATKLLGEKAGVVSGCALLVDYILTITTSVASGCDQLWNFLPAEAAPFKLGVEVLVLVILVVLNLRGVKESVALLVPIFAVFALTHAFAIVWVFASHAGSLPAVFSGAAREIRESRVSMGFWPLAFVLLRAYSMGGGTYTGIEAVSNGVTILREPRVRTGKRTMFLMAASLAFTAGGILFGYLLVAAHPQEGKTMNFVLFDALFGGWRPGGVAAGTALVLTLLVSEAALLFVAAQTGFLDGPRVLGNMAIDSWVPHRFAQLSDRLVTQNGVVLMGLAAVAALLYTRGEIGMLVVMYSINVFVTFSLTELGMTRHWIAHRSREPRWKSRLALHGSGLVLCVTILGITLYEKFAEGGWMTTVVTSAAIGLCFLIRRHYRRVNRDLKRLDDVLVQIAPAAGTREGTGELDRKLPTAILTVDRFSGYGLHQILSIHGLFPGYYRNLVFVSVAVVDSGSFKGSEEVERLEAATRESLEKYVAWARAHGWNAAYRMAVDTEALEKVTEICAELAREFPRSVVFSGKLVFSKPRWYDTILHNETAYAIQRRLQVSGVPAIVLPVRAAV